MRLIFVMFSILALGATVAAQTASTVGGMKTVEKTFADGGDLQLRLSADDYKVVPTNDDRIIVSWDASKDRNGKVRVTINTSGAQATVQTNFPHDFPNRPALTIQIPSRSNVKVRLSAGDLTVGPVEGNLDVEVHVGDLHLEIHDPTRFASVDASTRIGDLKPGPFNQNKQGWLGRTLKWQGNGSYKLHAHVGTGDLTIIESKETI